MRIIVCGGRGYSDKTRLREVLGGYLDHITVLIHGGASGADAMAAAWAHDHRVPVLAFRANWAENGLSAGPIRNQKMIDEGEPDRVIAFPGGKGTADMVAKALAAGVPVIAIQPHPAASTAG